MLITWCPGKSSVLFLGNHDAKLFSWVKIAILNYARFVWPHVEIINVFGLKIDQAKADIFRNTDYMLPGGKHFTY